MRETNRQVLLKSRPIGIPQSEHFEIVETPRPEPADGEFLVRNIYLGVEPAMRGWVNAVGNYAQPVALGTVMRSFAAGEIVRSRHRDYRVGERVTGLFGWQDYALSDGQNVMRKVARDPALPLSTSLGVLGLNGITAYFGLNDVAPPKAGETVVVSTGAGAVGSCAGQIAKILGCRSVAITGGAVKVALCRGTFRFDDAIDYKAEGDLGAALKKACPSGVDVYFDNTAGAISDAVLAHLNAGARVAICGTVSVANWDPIPLGPRVERHLLVKRARMQGFLVFDFQPRYAEAVDRLSDWVKAGLIAYKEEFLDGIESAPDAIAGLYRGDNAGRRLIRLAQE